ncbi:hypothetical protein GCM10022628_05000 [Anoxybacillus suryakundensis]
MTTFLLAAKQAVEAHHGALFEEEAKRWERVYDRILAKAQHRLETTMPLPKKALAFVRRLQKRKEEALRFLREVHVLFDNNQARAFSITRMPYLCWAFLYTSTGVNSYIYLIEL